MFEFINTAVTASGLDPTTIAAIGGSIVAVAAPLAKAAIVTAFPWTAPVFAFFDVIARQHSKVINHSSDKNIDLKRFAQEQKLGAVSYLIKH